MTEDIVIKVDNVSKKFRLPHERAGSVKSIFTNPFNKNRRTVEVQHALKNISFEIKKGEFFGIVGRNGSGKSTLLKMLAGIYQPTSGNIRISGRLVPFIELGVGFNPELTGRENVYLNGALLGFSEKEVDGFYEEVVSFAELERFMDQKLKNYSSGMQVRLAFSMAVQANADILLIDEVLAVGDADFQQKCYNYFKLLKKNKKTVIFVSHDMGAIREYCDRAALIENSKLISLGSSIKISSEYSRLFTDNTENNATENSIQVNESDKRWGNGHIRMDNVHISHYKNSLLIVVRATAYQQIDNAMYGLHIFGQDGSEITAMNNRMIQKPDIKDITAGTQVELKWDMLNIFNSGNYFITLTLVNEAGIAFDWWSEATNFEVKKIKHSTTSVLPPVDVECRII